jgi:hypothetical protein
MRPAGKDPAPFTPVRTLPLSLCLLVSSMLAGSALPARAQAVGVRAGVSGDPDQFYAGVHFESQPLVDRLRFRPNLEIGVGSDQTLVALNFEFAYPFPLPRTRWRLYVGGGPALNLYHSHEDTSPEGGFNIVLGLEHRDGLFTELKVGALDSPSVKFAIGYTFRP